MVDENTLTLDFIKDITMQKKIAIKEVPAKEIIKTLVESLSIDPILATILAQRGIKTFDEAKSFFRPSLEDLHDPFLMKNMDKAVARIGEAIENSERILVYGDYDVDGITAVASMYSFLSGITEDLGYYIPDRYAEGYGVSMQGVDYAYENEFSLIICLDCGIRANKVIAYAAEKGIDFIVCDHHLPGDEVPSALAVLDPKQSDCNYPFKELSGCGVGFKLIQAFSISFEMPLEDTYSYLDLVAISIASDIVPIVGENRTLMFYGLQQLNKTPRIGIKAFIDFLKTNKELTVTDIVFYIAPRINAAGRIDHGKKAVDLLVNDDVEIAAEILKDVNENNTTRKELDQIITAQGLAMIEAQPNNKERCSTVLFHPDWSKGVVGIVASRLIESYYRPTILFSEAENKLTGSARSVKGFDIYEAISACSEYIEQFGGHKYAAGITLKKENFKPFRDAFESIVAKTIPSELKTPEVEVDSEINFKAITPKFFRILKQLSPFGPENMTPIFKTDNLIANNLKILKDSHLKFIVKDPKSNISFDAIAFNLADRIKDIEEQKPFTLIYSIEENVWNGNTTLQLMVYEILI